MGVSILMLFALFHLNVVEIERYLRVMLGVRIAMVTGPSIADTLL